MGLLTSLTSHLDVKPPYYELTLAISVEDGQAYSGLSLDQRDAVYQAALDAIREQAEG